MKKTHRIKLALKKETIRALSSDALAKLAGGTRTDYCTDGTECPQQPDTGGSLRACN